MSKKPTEHTVIYRRIISHTSRYSTYNVQELFVVGVFLMRNSKCIDYAFFITWLYRKSTVRSARRDCNDMSYRLQAITFQSAKLNTSISFNEMCTPICIRRALIIPMSVRVTIVKHNVQTVYEYNRRCTEDEVITHSLPPRSCSLHLWISLRDDS